MKKILISLFCVFFTITAIAQSTTPSLPDNFKFEGNDFVITEIVQVEGKNSSVLFKDALLWVNKTFTNPKTVIQTKDQELGLITLKTIISDGSISWYEVNISIQVKDGRYKYDITDIVHALDVREYGEGIIKNQVTSKNINAEETITLFNPIVNGLKKQMVKQEEEW